MPSQDVPCLAPANSAQPWHRRSGGGGGAAGRSPPLVCRSSPVTSTRMPIAAVASTFMPIVPHDSTRMPIIPRCIVARYSGAFSFPYRRSPTAACGDLNSYTDQVQSLQLVCRLFRFPTAKTSRIGDRDRGSGIGSGIGDQGLIGIGDRGSGISVSRGSRIGDRGLGIGDR